MFKINSYSLFFLGLLFVNNPNVDVFSSTRLNNNTVQSQKSLFPDIFPQAGNNDSTSLLLSIESSVTPQLYNSHFNSSTHTFIHPFMLSGWGNNMSTDTFNINNFSHPITYQSEDFSDTFCNTNNIPIPSVLPDANQDRNHVHAETKKKKYTKTYTCPTCNKNLGSKSAFDYHLKTHNPNRPRPYQCHLCNKSYAEKHILKSHIERHNNEKPFKCDFCSKSFKTKYERMVHHRTHTGEKPYQCTLCGKLFKSKQGLTKHIRSRTGKKPFKCPICQKGLSSKIVLKDHLNRHKNIKPYKCNLCTKAYTSKYRYNEHMKMHDSSQLYTCKYCKANFLYKSEYENHMRYEQSTDEHLKCHLCKKVYIDKYILEQHNKRAHPDT